MASIGWAKPKYTRSRVRNAGKRIKEHQATTEDWLVL